MTAVRTERAGWRSVAGGMLLLFAATPMTQAAGVYKWVDAQGVVHYDDKNLLSLPLTQADLDQRKIAPRPTRATPIAFVRQVEQQCQINRERLANYREARELYGQDPAGDVYLLSPRQVGITIAETERDAGITCAKGAADRLYALQLAEPRKPKNSAVSR